MTVKEFELHAFDEILNDIKYWYLENLNKKEMLWQCAKYNFLYCALRECSINNKSDLNLDGYSYHMQTYFEEAIQARTKYECTSSLIKLKGKILVFDVHSSMFDCLGEKETGGFIDGCDTPPPEFWIHFDGEILYSYIPAEFIEMVNSAIMVSMSESLEWKTDLIEI
jgi:hypothetical protein